MISKQGLPFPGQDCVERFQRRVQQEKKRNKEIVFQFLILVLLSIPVFFLMGQSSGHADAEGVLYTTIRN
jgi:predicted nucleic acid-binding Zn ribbon protein